MPNEKIEAKVEEFAEKFVKVPCDCPKGGRIGENEYICPKCDGTEWVADPNISDWLRQALLSARNEALQEAELDKAEQQIRGFYHCYQGYDLTSLIEAMALRNDEWEKMAEKGMLDYLPKELGDEILASLRTKE